MLIYMANFLSDIWLMLKLFYRDRQSVFWNYLFPILLQIILCSVFGGGNRDLNLFFLSSLLLITIMSGSLYGIGIVIPSLREAGIFRRYRVSPASGWLVIGPAVMARFIVILSAVSIQILICTVFYHAVPQGSLASLLAVVLLGNATFCALSLIIANVARAAHTANAMANVLMMPMIFLSGAITPLEKMPGWIKTIAYLCPATPLIASLRQTMLLGSSLFDLWLHLGLLSFFSIAFLLFAFRKLKWE